MRKLFILSLLFLSLHSYAQSPSWAWARQGIGDAEGLSIATDASGNVYACGGYEDTAQSATITFDTTVLHSSNYGGVYLTKYNSNGDLLWAKSSDHIGFAMHVATDADQNVFIVGLNMDTFLVFGNDTVFNHGSPVDVFLVKYDSSGNELWARGAGGNSQDNGEGVATDQYGNVFITGETYSDTLHFGSTALTAGYGGIFIAKYDPGGNLLWAKVTQDSSLAASAGVVTNIFGSAIIAGYFRGNTISLGTSTLMNTDLNYYSDLFLMKFDGSGNLTMARTDGVANEGEESYSICRVGPDHVGITGVFGGSPGWTFGTSVLTPSSGTGDFFIAEYDTAGNPLWARQSTGSTMIGFSVTGDANENIYASGGAVLNTPSLVSFDSIQSFVPASSDESFIVKYDLSGNVQWLKLVNGGGDDQNAVAAGNNGDLFFGGDFIPSPFILGPDTLFLYGGESPFVAKFNSAVEIGLAENNVEDRVSIYPNPFSSCTVLHLKQPLDQTTLFLFDVYGKVVREEEVSGSTITIARNNLRSGIYFLRIEEKGSVIASGKLIIRD